MLSERSIPLACRSGGGDGPSPQPPEFPDLAVWLPYHHFESETLTGHCTVCILMPILRQPDYLASLVEPIRSGVVVAQSGKRRHDPVLPNRSEALPMSAETAKV